MAARRTTTDEEDLGKAAMLQSSVHAQAQARRKGIGVKVWLVVSETGQSHLEEFEKHSIMRRTGLHARDLRALDPMLSYPSSILGRERAIVINLEHIKAVITAKEVLMINSSNPLFLLFVQDLQTRVSGSSGAPQQVILIPSSIQFSLNFFFNLLKITLIFVINACQLPGRL